MSGEWHFPLVLTRLIEEQPCIVSQSAQRWFDRWAESVKRGPPPRLSAVKGLRSDPRHMTTRPAPRLDSEWLMRPCGTPFLVLFSGGRVICMIAARGNEWKREQCSVSTGDIDQVMCSANDAPSLNVWTRSERSLPTEEQPILMYSSSPLLKDLSDPQKHLTLHFWRKRCNLSLLVVDFLSTLLV